MSYADDLQAVSVDEALIDVTTAVKQIPLSPDKFSDPAKAFAELLRNEIKKSTGCDGKRFLHILVLHSFNIFHSKHWHLAQHHACTACYAQGETCRLIPSAARRLTEAH